MKRKGESLLELNDAVPSWLDMGEISARIRQRMAELDMRPADLARKLGVSPQRLNNYIKTKEPHAPDVDMVKRLARAMQTSTDWLLGMSASAPADVEAVFLRLLELSGMPTERASVVAAAAQEALRILSALPDEGDARTVARVAAQAAWQSRPETKPN